MAGLQLFGNEPPSQLNLDQLDRYFVIPVTFSPEMLEEAWQAEIEAMFKASKASRAFVDGAISPDDFSGVLSDFGYDPHELWERWDNGYSLNDLAHG